jgi:hypothetical protein
MYERIDIWKRVGPGLAIRFQCLRRVSDGMFGVQNADYLRSGSRGVDAQASEARFIELLLDDDPTNRCDWFSSLSETISVHEREFGDVPRDV